MTSITITGLDEVLAKLGKMERVHTVLRRPMDKSLMYLQDQVQPYPPKAAGAFSAMATPRQKRAFWARVRSGEIDVNGNGYVRTRNIGNRWTTRIQAGGGGMKGVLGNNAPGAEFVHGKFQQPFHRASGFKKTEDVANKSRAIITGWFRDEIRRALNK